MAPLVRENPSLNVKQLLEKLQNEGHDVDVEKFKEFKKREVEGYKNRRSIDKKSKEKKKRSPERMDEEFPIKAVSLPKEEPKTELKGKQANIREKGRILMNMKEIFGAERSNTYFKFIEQNFELGEAGIIEKWINTYEI